MSDPNKVEEVKPAEGDGAATPPATPPENVPSPEVKPEPTPPKEEVKVEDTVKMQEQINNLNIALKQEREKPKVDPAKVTELETQLKESQTINEKLKQVFVPENIQEETPEYMTKEEAEDFFKKKTEEQEVSKKEESHKENVKEQNLG